MRFINTKRFSPVIYENDLPHKKDMYFISPKVIPDADKQYETYSKQKAFIIDVDWWKIQEYRCLHGYTIPDAIEKGGDCFTDDQDVFYLDDNTVFIPHLELYIKDRKIYITGRMYFYLNFWKIKRLDENTGNKRIMNPKFTDLSWENWTIRDMMVKKKKDNLWAKCRQRGLSEEEACNLAYDFLFVPESQGVIVAGQEIYSENTFKFIKRGLRELKNTQFYKTLERNTDDWILSKYTGSEIYCRTAKDNPEVLSGLTPSKVLYEEIGIWKKGLVKQCAEFVKPSQHAEGTKTGYSQYTGTGGEIEKGVEDMEEMTMNPEKFDLLEFKNRFSKEANEEHKIACFIPAWKFEIIDEDGNSLRERATKEIEAWRAKVKPKERYTRITQKPLWIEEIFNVSSGGFFGAEIIQLLNERYFYIASHRESQIERSGRLEWNDKSDPWKGVKFIDDPAGELIIIEEPRLSANKQPYTNLYIAGTDSYDQDEAEYSDSKGSIVVKKRVLNPSDTYNIYVAHLLQRPNASKGGAEIFYENCAKLCIYYNCCINNIEWSNPRIFDWFVNHGFTSLLMERPMIAIANVIKQSFLQNRFGTDKSLKPHYLAILRDKLSEDFINRMFIRRQILALGKFRYDPSGKKYNCDTTISTGLVELADKEYEFVLVNNPEEKKTERILHYINIDGNLKAVWL